MKLLLKRIFRGDKYTIGHLYIDGNYYCDVLEDTDRGLSSDMTEEEIQKIKIYGKTAIPKGRYKIEVTYSPKFKRHLPLLIGVKGFSGIRIHCLTPDTEILTENGWQNLESFKNNTPKMCYSYNTETKKIELKDINFFVENEYNGIIYKNEGRRINYAVTDKHQMYVGYRKRDGEIDWRFVNAEDIGTGQRKFITSGFKSDGYELSEEQKNIYRIIMAVQADGYILNYSNTASQVRFHLKKQRKIDRIKKLVESVGCQYNEYVDCEGKTHIKFDSKLSGLVTEIMNPNRYMFNYKELPVELLNLKSNDIKDLIIEYLFWDGRYENYLKNNHNMIITSTNENTIDMIQAMCSLCGFRSNKKLEKPKNGGHSNLWNLVFYDNQTEVLPESNTYTNELYNGTVWCINNDNHTIITRQNGRTVILGNCGNSHEDTLGCLLVGFNKVKGQVINSRVTSDKLTALLRNTKEEIHITIE